MKAAFFALNLSCTLIALVTGIATLLWAASAPHPFPAVVIGVGVLFLAYMGFTLCHACWSARQRIQ